MDIYKSHMNVHNFHNKNYAFSYDLKINFNNI
jgi:hypothetical protein